MTHPLTPREKVADDLKLVLAHAMVEELRHQHPGLEQIDSERGDLWLPGGCTPQSSGCVIDIHSVAASVEREVSGLLKEAYRDGWSDREGDFLVGFDRIAGNTALASGSGDHAELAVVAWRGRDEDAFGGGAWAVCSFKPSCEVVEPLVTAASAEALLAEIAALRGEHVHLVEQKEGAEDALFNALSRATEAERKLAEAVGLLEPFAKLADEEGGYREDDRLAWGLNTADINWGDLRAARTFLSKEAEQ